MRPTGLGADHRGLQAQERRGSASCLVWDEEPRKVWGLAEDRLRPPSALAPGRRPDRRVGGEKPGDQVRCGQTACCSRLRRRGCQLPSLWETPC